MKPGIPLFSALVLAGTIAFASEFTAEEISEMEIEAGLTPGVLALKGDVDYGAYLSGECTTCHQTSGDNDGIPPIVGYDELFFKLAMHEYKAKSRDHPVMQMIAGRLADDEIAALAAYFSQLEPQD